MVGCLILCIFLKRFLVDIFTPIERHPAGFESDMAKMQAYNFCILSRFALHHTSNVSAENDLNKFKKFIFAHNATYSHVLT